jgi:hypothetical protein
MSRGKRQAEDERNELAELRELMASCPTSEITVILRDNQHMLGARTPQDNVQRWVHKAVRWQTKARLEAAARKASDG